MTFKLAYCAGAIIAATFTASMAFAQDCTPSKWGADDELGAANYNSPERTMAAIRYSGFWSEKNYLKNADKLKAWVVKKGFNAVGDPVWARYDAPYMPWFLRRNEILVTIEMPINND